MYFVQSVKFGFQDQKRSLATTRSHAEGRSIARAPRVGLRRCLANCRFWYKHEVPMRTANVGSLRECVATQKLLSDNFPRRNGVQPTTANLCSRNRVNEIACEFYRQAIRSPHIFTRKSRLQPGKFLISSAKRLLQHGVIPGSSPDKAPGISSLGMHEAILMWPRKRLESSSRFGRTNPPLQTHGVGSSIQYKHRHFGIAAPQCSSVGSIPVNPH